MHQSDTRKAHN